MMKKRFELIININGRYAPMLIVKKASSAMDAKQTAKKLLTENGFEDVLLERGVVYLVSSRGSRSPQGTYRIISEEVFVRE